MNTTGTSAVVDSFSEECGLKSSNVVFSDSVGGIRYHGCFLECCKVVGSLDIVSNGLERAGCAVANSFSEGSGTSGSNLILSDDIGSSGCYGTSSKRGESLSSRRVAVNSAPGGSGSTG